MIMNFIVLNKSHSMHFLAKILLTLILVSGVASAKSLSPEDFAYNAPILEPASGDKASLRQLNLPVIVYEGMQRRDYGDLRVFSKGGQAAPQYLRQIEQQSGEKGMVLPVFPLSEEQSRNPSSIQVIIKQQSDQQKLEINQPLTHQNAVKKNNDINQYIIKNSEKQAGLCRLSLSWTSPKANVIAPFSLQASNDLQNWRALGARFTVSRFNMKPNSAHQLGQTANEVSNNEVDINCVHDAYLRLAWLKPGQGNVLLGVNGYYRQGARLRWLWKSLGKPTYDREGNWLFENDTVAALSKLALVAPQSGLLYKGVLYSRNNEKAPWRYVVPVIQYRLDSGGEAKQAKRLENPQQTELQSSPVLFKPNSDRYWKLRLENEARLGGNQLPEIRVSWRENALIFLAQGEPPFKLAFGNPEVGPPRDAGLMQLLQGTEIKPLQVSLGKAQRVAAYRQPTTPFPWKKIAFWMLLLLGVAVLALMALSLFRQMNNEKQ